MYYTYIIRCEDNTLYTGITNDLKRRMSEHFNKTLKCAKYTMSHTAKKFEIAFESENKSEASKLEFHIKRLKKSEKEELIKNKDLEKYFNYKFDTNCYKISKTKID